jgi:hypothetical protein
VGASIVKTGIDLSPSEDWWSDTTQTLLLITWK